MLYKNIHVKQFILGCREAKINAFIGGSSGLHAVYKDCNFTPNDIDVYIKNCSRNQLIQIENVIRKIFPTKSLLVVRSPIVVTWMVYSDDDENQQVILQIQVNILQITR